MTDPMGWGSWAGAWLPPLASLALIGILAAALFLRDHLRLQQHALSLEADLERLQDRVWQLAEGEERYRGLVEAQLDIIVQRDGAGRITFANDGYAELIGQPRESLIGSELRLEPVERGPVQVRADGVQMNDEAFATPSGIRWIAWIATAVSNRHGAPELLKAGRDITERVRTERELQEARLRAEAASEAKSRFLATVSHEIRTPLNGILGMADLVLDTSLDPEQATYTRAIKTSGEALLSLINEILDFSKIEAGRIDLTAESFDLAALIEGQVELLAPRAQGKGIEIAAYVDPAVPRQVLGDPDRLRQIIMNLAGNAVKFTEVGGVGILVERGVDDEVVFLVSDTGPGVSLERLPTLFEEFEQGDGSASRRHGGTGLGLAITQRIVQRMGGRIEVASEIGRGTTFRVTLPLSRVPSLAASSEPVTPLAGKRAVILARSPYEAPFLARRLSDVGATVAVVETAGEALAKIATQPCDVFIADCALGDQAVREVAREVRRVGVGLSIVLLSPFDRRDFGPPDASGFDAYLVKPVRPRSLMQRLAAQPRSRTNRDIPRRSRAVSARRERAAFARVLLAEDNEINALLAVKSLEKLGAVVDWAKDGQEALALAEASFAGVRAAYDLVLMDIRMPGLDGLEATRRIRAIEGALGRPQPVRIIALTANAAREDQAAALAAGLDGFLAKPFAFDDLTRVLGEAKLSLAEAS